MSFLGSACVAAGIGHIHLNHSPRQAHVGDRYSNADDLRTAIEDVAAFLLEEAGAV